MAQHTRRARLLASFELSYNLSRKYPFRSFKWTSLVLMTVLVIIFTIFNVATNGYAIQSVVTLDPNSTEAERKWFNNGIFTWGDDKLNPKCQNIDIGIGRQFLTRHQGTVYTVNGISGPCGENAQTRQCPSISYHAQFLDKCSVDSVTINLVKTDDSASNSDSFWWSYAPTTGNAQAHCNVSGPSGTYTIGFNSFFPGATKSFGDFLAVEDYNSSASLWWGSRLMDSYLTGVKDVTAQGGSSNSSVNTRNGLLIYTTSNTTSMKGSALFNMDFFIYNNDGGIFNPNSVRNSDQKTYFNNKSFWLSPILTEGLFFAKMYYSFVLTDLGQNHSSNLLVDEQSLQYALDPDDDANRQAGGKLDDQTQFDWWRWNTIAPPGIAVANSSNSVPMSDAFSKFPKPILGTQPTKIYSQYVCSVPQRKGISTIILIVLINDFVLISAAWTVLMFVATAYATTMDPMAMYCEGCAAQKKNGQGDNDNVALLPLKSQRSGFTFNNSLPDGSGRGYESLHGDDDAVR